MTLDEGTCIRNYNNLYSHGREKMQIKVTNELKSSRKMRFNSVGEIMVAVTEQTLINFLHPLVYFRRPNFTRVK